PLRCGLYHRSDGVPRPTERGNAWLYSPRPERAVAVLPEQERRQPPVERAYTRHRQLAAHAERDVAAAAERQVQRRPEQRRRVHRGVERLGLLELECGHEVLLVGPERILEREEVAHLPRCARRICRQ